MTELSEQDVARIAAAVADELRKNPPRLSDEDISRIADALAIHPLLDAFIQPLQPRTASSTGVRLGIDDDLFERVIAEHGEPAPPGPLPEKP